MQFALAETLQMHSLVKVTRTSERGLILQGEHEDLPPQGRWRYHTFFIVFLSFSIQCLESSDIAAFLVLLQAFELAVKEDGFSVMSVAAAKG